MPSTLLATVTAEGGQTLLDAYRQRFNAALADESAVALTELHTAGHLEYRITARDGLPFPALVAASADVPELLVRIEWRDREEGAGGVATIQAGALKEQASRPREADAGGHRGVDVRAAADGTIELAVACRQRGDDWIGYALTATQHAFFRVRPGPMLEATDGVDLEWAERWRIAADGDALYAELDPREPLDATLAAELGTLADAFAEDWVWFVADDPVETAVERARFAAYGFPVRDANLRSARLRGAMQREDAGHTFSSLDASGRYVAALVKRYWLQSERA